MSVPTNSSIQNSLKSPYCGVHPSQILTNEENDRLRQRVKELETANQQLHYEMSCYDKVADQETEDLRLLAKAFVRFPHQFAFACERPYVWFNIKGRDYELLLDQGIPQLTPELRAALTKALK